jgi:hypothetical protein
MPDMFLNGGGMRRGMRGGSLGMVLRRPCPSLDGLTDISAYGGWHAYLSRDMCW